MTSSLALGPREAHVWLDRLGVVAPWSADAATDEERSRAARMQAPDRRAAFLRGRAAARWLAARYCGVTAREIVIAEADAGKPVLVMPAHEPLHLSITHSGDLLALAFTRVAEIGVDVEVMRAVDRDAIARRYFHAAEDAELAAREPRAFFEAWVCKEAVLKATGIGIAGLRDVELSFGAGEPTLAELSPTLGAPESWTLAMFDCGADACGAVAVRAAGVIILPRLVGELVGP